MEMISFQLHKKKRNVTTSKKGNKEVLVISSLLSLNLIFLNKPIREQLLLLFLLMVDVMRGTCLSLLVYAIWVCGVGCQVNYLRFFLLNLTF